ncbi:MAG: ABC transporter ATP-binding protein [Hahellaceae bacterium]|nr:ABC transporter ATP-binding protein [Hahellaceae bacterium]
MIEVKNLSRRYGDFYAVKNVSFSIAPGQIVGLLGHNGAGKTTIMKMLTGFLESTDGQIQIAGKDLQQHSLELRGQMGYLPESPPIYPEMTVFDYLEFAAQLKGVATAERETAVIDVIRKTDLGSKAAAPISTLSRGYRQRVGVAQALLNKPALLIMDEPTNGLDPTQIEHMRDLIRSLREHTTVILSTHIMQEVSAMCDRVLIIRHGELALDSTLEALKQSNRLLLKSTAPLEKVRHALEQHQGLTLIQDEQGRIHLTSQTGDLGEPQITEIARSLMIANIPFSALHPEIRDLETVFKEINNQKESRHAA